MKIVQFREAIAEAMSEEMRLDESIYLMGEEDAEYNGEYKASKGMLDEFGDKRVIDTPISELGFSGIGVGSTMTGNRPIIEFMTFNFALVGIDQIINNASKILFVNTLNYLISRNFELIDCQVWSKHLQSLGATKIPRAIFLEKLEMLCNPRGNGFSWTQDHKCYTNSIRS